MAAQNFGEINGTVPIQRGDNRWRGRDREQSDDQPVRGAVTNRTGNYSVPYLVRVSMISSRNLRVQNCHSQGSRHPGRRDARIDFPLEVGEVSQSVEVRRRGLCSRTPERLAWHVIGLTPCEWQF